VTDREARGGEAGDLVDAMVEGRVVLEKIKVLEGRMRYQIEKLVRVAEEPENNGNGIIDGEPILFHSFRTSTDVSNPHRPSRIPSESAKSHEQ